MQVQHGRKKQQDKTEQHALCSAAGLNLTNLGIEPRIEKRLLEEKLSALKDIQFRSGMDMRSANGRKLLGKGEVVSPRKIEGLVKRLASDRVSNEVSIGREVCIALLLYELVGIELNLIRGVHYDFTSIRKMIERIASDIDHSKIIYPSVESLADQIQCSDPILAKQHQLMLQCALLSAAIAGYLKKSGTQIVEVFTVGLFADLGMVFLDPEIAHKSTINETEYEHIKIHPTISFRILAKGGQFSNSILAGIHGHQKHLDRSGYPEEVTSPNEHAKLVCVVATFCAMRQRGQSVTECVRALKLNTKKGIFNGQPLQPRYAELYVNALAFILNEYLKDEAASEDTHGVAIFDNPGELAIYLEKIVNISQRLKHLEAKLDLIRNSRTRKNRQALEEFVKQLEHLARLVQVDDVESHKDVQYYLSNLTMLGKLERNAKALVSEMNRVRIAVQRCSGSIRQIFSDEEFQEIFGDYIGIVHNIAELKSLVRKKGSKLPWE